MNSPLPGDAFDPSWHSSDWFDARNVDGSTIPAHAVVMVSGSDVLTDTVEYYAEIEQYDGTNGLVFLNSNKAVSTDSPFTEISKVYPQLALYDTNETPAVGDEWGPIEDEWRLGSEGSGFIIMGIVDSFEGIAIVDRAEGGAGNDHIKFTIISVDEACTYATVSIDYILCSATTVPEDYNGTVDAYDVDCKFSGIAKPDLEGLQGDAQYMKPYGTGACQWVITDLCCPDDHCA